MVTKTQPEDYFLIFIIVFLCFSFVCLIIVNLIVVKVSH